MLEDHDAFEEESKVERLGIVVAGYLCAAGGKTEWL